MKRAFYIRFIILALLLIAPRFSRASTSYENYDSERLIGMNVVFGFSNTVKQNCYNQAVFFIKNEGNDFSGKVLVKVGSSQDSSFRIYSKKIFLPALSKKRIYIYFYFGQMYAPPIFYELVSDTGETVFSANVIKEKTVNVLNSYPYQEGTSGFLTTVISDNNFGYNFLTGVNTTPKVRGMINYIRILGHNVEYPTYETLPDDSKGYDGVNLILLSSMTGSKLSFDQKRAIIRYLYEGGNILIAKSDNDLWLEDEFISSILPCSIDGTVRTLDKIRFYNNAGRKHETPAELYTFPKGFPVIKTSLKSGAIALARSDDTPLVIKKDVKSGTVFFTAFNPSTAPFSGKKETDALIGQIFNNIKLIKGIPLEYRYNDTIIGIYNKLLDSILTKEIIKKIVTFFVIAFMVYVLLIGPLNYFILKRNKKLEFAWITIPAISFIFSLLFLISGYVARGMENYFFTYNIVKVNDSNIFQLESFLSVFASKAGSYDIDFERQNIDVDFFSKNKTEVSGYEVEVSDTIKVKDVDIKKWSVKNFTVSGYIYEDSDYFVTFREKGGRLYEFDYNLPFDIEKMFFISVGQVYKINIEKVNKDKTISLDGKEFGYYKDRGSFSKVDMLEPFKSEEERATLDQSRLLTSRSKIELLGYLEKKGLYKPSDSPNIFMFTKGAVYDCDIKDIKFKKTDKTILIIKVQEK